MIQEALLAFVVWAILANLCIVFNLELVLRDEGQNFFKIPPEVPDELPLSVYLLFMAALPFIGGWIVVYVCTFDNGCSRCV